MFTNLMEEPTIITGQFVRISQTSASLGERMLALCIDYGCLGIYLIGITLSLSKLNIHTSSELSFLSLFLILYAPALAYPFLCEMFNRGQSLGKRVFNLRVVKVDGSTPSIGSYLLRWLFFPIDLPITGGLGVLVILLNKNRQRLGDLAAGTMVIKEQNYRKIQVSLDEFDYLTQNYHPVYPSAAELSLEQINVIARTLASGKKDREHRIEVLANKVYPLLALKEPEANNEKFLQTVLRDYQYFALEEI